jgi:membrane-associated phospholipid phosphatase
MSFDMKWKNVFGSFVICAVLIIAGCLYLDIRLAQFVTEMVGFGFLSSARVSELPDFLFLTVCITTVGSWTGRIYLSRKPVESWNLSFLEYIGYAVPLAFILKQLLKDLFGKTNARFWLLHPDQFGFHWFHGGGDFSAFPSGHMTVFAVLLLGISRYFPKLRPTCSGLLLVLALALIITQYHFFSDIVAGLYLGLIVDSLTRQGLSFLHRSPNSG